MHSLWPVPNPFQASNGCGSALVSARIRIQHFIGKSGSGSRVLMTKEFLKKCTTENVFDKKFKFFYWSLGLYKDVQVTGEAFSPQNMKFLQLFYYCGSFFPSYIRIWIQPTKINPDPDSLWEGMYCVHYSLLVNTIELPFISGFFHTNAEHWKI